MRVTKDTSARLEPHEEDKLVRVTQGAVFDVIADLRRGSATFGRWFGIELSAANRRQLYVPRGCAHGFQTLTDATEGNRAQVIGNPCGSTCRCLLEHAADSDGESFAWPFRSTSQRRAD